MGSKESIISIMLSQNSPKGHFGKYSLTLNSKEKIMVTTDRYGETPRTPSHNYIDIFAAQSQLANVDDSNSINGANIGSGGSTTYESDTPKNPPDQNSSGDVHNPNDPEYEKGRPYASEDNDTEA